MGVMGKHGQNWVSGVWSGTLGPPVLHCRGRGPAHPNAALPTVIAQGKAPARPSLPAMGEDKDTRPWVGEGETPSLPKAGLGADIAGKAEHRPGLGLGRE